MIRGLDVLSRNISLLQKRQRDDERQYCQCQYKTGYHAKALFQSALDEVALHNYQSGPNADTRRDIGGLSLGTQLAGSTISQDQGAVKQTDTPAILHCFPKATLSFFSKQCGSAVVYEKWRLYRQSAESIRNTRRLSCLGCQWTSSQRALGPANFQIQSFPPEGTDYRWSKLRD